jgi:hypothetical protein
MTFAVLLAFFLQSLLVQTHVHESLAPVAATTIALHGQAPAPLKNQDPLDQCRLCQELAHAGSFFTPSAAVLAVSLSFIAATFVPLRDPADSSAKPFAWQSRAPPR